jgi:hypothetical protein
MAFLLQLFAFSCSVLWSFYRQAVAPPNKDQPTFYLKGKNAVFDDNLRLGGRLHAIVGPVSGFSFGRPSKEKEISEKGGWIAQGWPVGFESGEIADCERKRETSRSQG